MDLNPTSCSSPPTSNNKPYGVWVWISSQGLVSWPFYPHVPRPELQPAFSWYFHLPESSLCWPLGIAWISSFEAKSELTKPSNAALKSKLKQHNLSFFFFFFKVPWTTLFLSGRDDRKFVCSPKSHIRDFMSLGVLFILFWAGRTQNTRSGEKKQQHEPTHTERRKQGQDFSRPSCCVGRIHLIPSDSRWKSSTFSIFLSPPASCLVVLLLGHPGWQ